MDIKVQASKLASIKHVTGYEREQVGGVEVGSDLVFINAHEGVAQSQCLIRWWWVSHGMFRFLVAKNPN